MTVPLDPGTYVIGVSWTAAPLDPTWPVEYQLTLALEGEFDNAPPLLSGPAPAVQIRLDGAKAATASGPIVTLPPAGPGPAPSPPSANGVIFAALQIVDAAPARPAAPAAPIGPSTGALLALADGPVGGTGNGRGGSNALSIDQVAIRLPDTPAGTLVDVTVTTLLVDGGSAGKAPAPSAARIIDQLFGTLKDGSEQLMKRFIGPLRSVIDALFQGDAWWEGPRASAPAADAMPQDNPPALQLQEDEPESSAEARAAGAALAIAAAGAWLNTGGVRDGRNGPRMNTDATVSHRFA